MVEFQLLLSFTGRHKEKLAIECRICKHGRWLEREGAADARRGTSSYPISAGERPIHFLLLLRDLEEPFSELSKLEIDELLSDIMVEILRCHCFTSFLSASFP